MSVTIIALYKNVRSQVTVAGEDSVSTSMVYGAKTSAVRLQTFHDFSRCISVYAREGIS